MKSKIKKSTYAAIYRLLDRVSPIDGDCGRLCSAACCNCGGDSVNPDGTVNEDGLDYTLGIYLLPGEEKLFTQKEDWLKWSVEYAEDYDFPDSWFGKIYFVRCKTPPFCPRKKRPLQCRFFPLAPHLTRDGRLQLILSDVDLPYRCPLIESNAGADPEYPLNPRFIRATYTVWKRLLEDPRIRDLVRMDSDIRLAELAEGKPFFPIPIPTC